VSPSHSEQAGDLKECVGLKERKTWSCDSIFGGGKQDFHSENRENPSKTCFRMEKLHIQNFTKRMLQAKSPVIQAKSPKSNGKSLGGKFG